MRLRLTVALLLASAVAAQAQHQPQPRGQSTATTPASQMAGRAAASAHQLRDALANGVAGVYAAPADSSSEQPADAQRIIRGQVNGTANDPVLHYPYGRYQPTLGNVNPDSLSNPFTNGLGRGGPGTASPAPPGAFTPVSPAFQRGR